MKTSLLTILSVFFALSAFSQDLEFKDGRYYKKDMLYTGTHTEYFENKQVKVRRNIKNGIEDGLIIFYYESGQIKEQRSYKEGLKDGLWINWDENGTKTAEAVQ